MTNNEFWIAGKWKEDGCLDVDAGLSSACITIPCMNVFTSKKACEKHIRLSRIKDLKPIQVAAFSVVRDVGDSHMDLISAVPEHEEFGDTW